MRAHRSATVAACIAAIAATTMLSSCVNSPKSHHPIHSPHRHSATASHTPTAPPTPWAPPKPPPPPVDPYPWHTNIVSTTFWVGEIFDPNASDGSQVISTYD